MRRIPVSWLNGFLCLAVVIVFNTGCKRAGGSASGQAENQGGDHYFHTQFQDESQFIVEQVVTDVAEQVYYAKRHKLPETKYFSIHAYEKGGSIDAPIYDVKVTLDAKLPPVRLDVPVNGPIWSADTYKEITAVIAKSVGLDTKPQQDPNDTLLLQSLSDGLASTIEQEDQNLSAALDGDFSNPDLHQKAAVLLGAFTLRDHSRLFHDVRLPLCRMSAHLIMAHYLAGDPAFGINGQVAEAMLLTLMNDQALALDALKNIPTTDESAARWVRVLKARNNYDYRELATVKKPTLVEILAWFEAYSRSVDNEAAWAKVERYGTNYPDFCRILNNVGFSVGTAHDIMDVSVPLELRETAIVYFKATGQKLQSAQLATVLNDLPSRCFDTSHSSPEIKVIGWGQWALFLQRHLCMAVAGDYSIYSRMWGLPDDAKAFAEHANQSFSGLRLYPFVSRFICDDSKTFHKATDDGLKLTVDSPQMVPARCWLELSYNGPSGEQYQPVPNIHADEWHKHNPLPGTVYNIETGLYQNSLVSRGDAIQRIEQLHDMAPYDTFVARYLFEFEYGKKPTHDQIMHLYGPLMAYSPSAVSALAETMKDQPGQYEALMTNAAPQSPFLYYTLGDYFQSKNEDDKTAYYYEKGATLYLDSLQAAARADWRIKYYLKKGQKAKARQVADDAGEVYSDSGLLAKAGYFEAIGDYPQAFEWYVKDEERYDESKVVTDFCQRYKAKTGDTRFDKELEKRVKTLFPGGSKKVSLKDFQSPPKDGIVITTDSELLQQAGLKPGCVIVAVYGIRVHNQTQYSFGRQQSGDPELNLIVWQDGHYLENKSSPPGHLFGVQLADYKP